MRQVDKLIDRVIKSLEDRGFEVEVNKFSAETAHEKKAGERWIWIHETYRGNGTEENTTVTMEVQTYHKAYNFESGFGMICTIEKIKVPKNASDKVVNSRIDKCVEYLG